MPINVEVFSSGKKEYSIKNKILLFLQSKPDKAFNIKEIIEGTGFSPQVVMENYGPVPESTFITILEDLTQKGMVEMRSIKKSIGKELYFKAITP